MILPNETILYDDRGLSTDFFKKTLENHKKILVEFSGGTDSSFTFWYFAKLLHDYDLKDHSILPFSGIELNKIYRWTDELEWMYEFISDSFPKANILPLYSFEFLQIKPKRKSEYRNPHQHLLKKCYDFSIVVTSDNAAPLFEDVDLVRINKERQVEDLVKSTVAYYSPFGFVDKKFIAYQYKKYNLMDNLFQYTVTCADVSVSQGNKIMNRDPTWFYRDRRTKDGWYPDLAQAFSSVGYPCKECDWCKERYWAFGHYDIVKHERK
tara:strand:- start:666 stop:1463 length:798 start_codon:yes stop_codon:yes gene_type:complete